jgi:hypothetical protein
VATSNNQNKDEEEEEEEEEEKKKVADGNEIKVSNRMIACLLAKSVPNERSTENAFVCCGHLEVKSRIVLIVRLFN